MSKRDTYVAKMKLQLDELNQSMSEISAKAREAKADAREKFDHQMAQMRADSQAAAAKLDDIKTSSEEGWHKLVSEMEKLRDAFKHSFAYFKSQV